MDTRVKFVLSCYMFLFMSPLFAAATRQSASSREIEAEKYLARVNKPFVKSIESPDGDIIDCVLIADQPAFDHPLLKNHNIQMRPSNYPEDASKSDTMAKTKFQLWHLNGSCPKGTIPIRRTRKKDVLRASSIEGYGTKTPDSIVIPPVPILVHEYALVRETGGKYFGTTASLNMWETYVEKNSIFSLTQLWVVAGNATTMNTAEAGWQVYPFLYDDYRPRLFGYFTNNNYQYRSGCYNLQCSGFVQVSNEIALGGAVGPFSSYNGKQFDLPIHIFMDPFMNAWWLKVQDELVGYWPASILPILSHGAHGMSWGGEVAYYNYNGQHTTTHMGSGHFPEEGYAKASYVRNIEVIHEDQKWGPPRNLADSATRPTCYRINHKTDGSWGNYFYYGGPGRSSECPGAEPEN